MTVDTAGAAPDARLEALIPGRTACSAPCRAGGPAATAASTRPDLFAFRDAMTTVEREVDGSR